MESRVHWVPAELNLVSTKSPKLIFAGSTLAFENWSASCCSAVMTLSSIGTQVVTRRETATLAIGSDSPICCAQVVAHWPSTSAR